MKTGPGPALDPAHVARIGSAYAAHLRALRPGFGITPVVVDYDYDRDYVDLPGLPRDLQLRAPLDGGLVVEAYEHVPGQATQPNRPWLTETTGLFCPRGDESGEWVITIARWEAVDQRAAFEYGRPPRIRVGLSSHRLDPLHRPQPAQPRPGRGHRAPRQHAALGLTENRWPSTAGDDDDRDGFRLVQRLS